MSMIPQNKFMSRSQSMSALEASQRDFNELLEKLRVQKQEYREQKSIDRK